MNGMLAQLGAYEPQISAAVGLISLATAFYGFVQLVVIPPLAARRAALAEGAPAPGFSFQDQFVKADDELILKQATQYIF